MSWRASCGRRDPTEGCRHDDQGSGAEQGRDRHAGDCELELPRLQHQKIVARLAPEIRRRGAAEDSPLDRPVHDVACVPAVARVARVLVVEVAVIHQVHEPKEMAGLVHDRAVFDLPRGDPEGPGRGARADFLLEDRDAGGRVRDRQRVRADADGGVAEASVEVHEVHDGGIPTREAVSMGAFGGVDRVERVRRPSGGERGVEDRPHIRFVRVRGEARDEERQGIRVRCLALHVPHLDRQMGVRGAAEVIEGRLAGRRDAGRMEDEVDEEGEHDGEDHEERGEEHPLRPRRGPEHPVRARRRSRKALCARCLRAKWARTDLNRRPSGYEPDAPPG